mmetsp:Transcript_94/g.140  ORF Transcript_94/g.140 Transcript_94/m.140 type:complete len:1060 (-) Transcript_94:72-3251(-)|eukprot:CAMPEP_0117003570 /NCGR_PEP_ID=MMETSP0472-20121206/4841_1 /TAXON_ID=693140 ORGANISM="Tiarina fusus, Strain LIS" /NCGR_SAMPLE_ID=MMETSP0472 /ASSEMBLY_ACC=CAM_ASM_000603 /LENGTH=1059 /DNA_ID=CAMNT_0004704253 /DNA_START=135 /DNA_END=3314 /DNA_ORIENTATION=-
MPTTNEAIKRRFPVRLRPQSENLFVRLSATQIEELKSDLLISSRHSTGDQEDAFQERSWKYEADGFDGAFLPLEVSYNGDASSSFCASYNGGISQEDVMEIPASLVSTANPNALSHVTVRALASIRHCTRVQMDPRTVEDWELLEVHAQALEQGGLLQQVSVVYHHQSVSLRLPGKTQPVVQLVVREISTTTETPWPSLEDEENAMFGLLVSDTEVIISPRPRPRQKTSEWSPPLRLLPCDADWTDEMRHLAETHGDLRSIVVPPGCILVNESSIDGVNKGSASTTLWAKISKATDDSKSCWARVVTSSQVPLFQAALHPWIRWDLDTLLYVDSVRIQLCEKDPVSISPEHNLVLLPIRTECVSTEDEQPWREPAIGYLRKIKTSRKSTNASKGSTFSFSVGSMLSSALFENDSCNMFRLAMWPGQDRTLHDSLPNVVTLNDESFKHILKESTAPTRGQVGTTNEAIHVPRDRNTWLPRHLVSSIEWTRPLIHAAKCSKRISVSLCGPRGSGKTHSALLLGSLISMSQDKCILYMDCAKLQDSTARMQEVLEELCTLFREAFQAQAVVIILDDLDKLAPNMLGGDEGDPGAQVQGTNPVAVDQSKAITDLIVHHIDALCKDKNFSCGGTEGISLILTSGSTNSLNPALRECVSTTKIDVPTLSSPEREAIFLEMLSASSDSVKWDEVEPPQLPENFRPIDIVKVVCRIQQQLWTQQRIQPHIMVENVLAGYIPISSMTLPQAKVTTGPDWNGIGGLFHVKSKLELTLLHPSRYRAIYARATVRLPRGILLFGPPGCGKSALVPALAKECGFPLIACRGPEVLDKYIGASEAKVRELFDRAMAVAPSILFLDELDALAPRRGSDHTGVTDRVVNQLLTYLDGVEDGAKGIVYVIGASSRPDKIDPALLRPGRLEEHLFVGPPHTDEEWTDLFTKVSHGWNLSKDSAEYLVCNSKQGMPTPLTRSGRFTPADFRACLNTAHVAAVHRALSSTAPDELKLVTICKDDLRVAFANCKPCLSTEDAAAQAQIYQAYGKRRIAQESGSASAGSIPRSAVLKTTLR